MPKASCEPAHSIVRRLGGDDYVAKSLGINRVTVWLWQVPPPRGRDGFVPRRHHEELLALAERLGVPMTAGDLFFRQPQRQRRRRSRRQDTTEAGAARTRRAAA